MDSITYCSLSPSCRARCRSILSLGFFFLQLLRYVSSQTINPGNWHILVENAGVSAMHMALTHKNTVIMFDRTDYGPSQIKLPNGNCRIDPNDLALKRDCNAHSIEYNIATNTIRPLEILSDSWCSSGGFLADGTLVSTGGYNDGARAVRHFVPNPGSDWSESFPQMDASRWYASNQILPDNSMFVVGGRGSFSYEFVPSRGGATSMDFLTETDVRGVENNLYPFTHLSSDGNLFIFAYKKSVLFDYNNNKVLKTFPDMPGGGRNYPSSGSSVMLPLAASYNFERVEILICGGAPDGSYLQANDNDVQVGALASCGRMVITDPEPSWAVEEMPTGRVMGDMLILPTGEILIINGAYTGTAGWGNARNPNLAPILYRSNAATGSRFTELASTTIARLYHSTANVLPDGRILVGGSNPNVGYDFSGVPFPTELRLEAYHPYYLDDEYATQRPRITYISSTKIGYGSSFKVYFAMASTPTNVEFRVYAPPFTTHTFSMNQRQLILAATEVRAVGPRQVSTLTAPPSAIAAPAGYYLLFVVNAGIPSPGAWVQLA